jgi:hypothetical protein
MENPIAAQGRQRSAVELSCETTTPLGSTTWSLDRARRTNASRLRRCQCYSQPFKIEAWLEKDALTGIIEDLLVHYRVTLNVGRGFDGWDPIHNAAQRLGDADVVGDFDPSGEHMVRSLRERLKGERSRPEIVKCALTMNDIEVYRPPADFTKASDTRSAAFVAKWGDVSVELDALPIEVLKERIAGEVELRLDLTALEAVRAAENPYVPSRRFRSG